MSRQDEFLTVRICKYLQSAGPCTGSHLMEILGEPSKRLYAALGSLVVSGHLKHDHLTGRGKTPYEFLSMPNPAIRPKISSGVRRYAPKKQDKITRAGSGFIATPQKRTFVPLRRNPLEMWELCMRAPFNADRDLPRAVR